MLIGAGSDSANHRPHVEIPRACSNPKWQQGGALLACTINEEVGDLARSGVAVFDPAGKLRHFVSGAGGDFAFLPDGSGLVAGTGAGESARLILYRFEENDSLFYSTVSGLYGRLAVSAFGKVFFAAYGMVSSRLDLFSLPVKGGTAAVYDVAASDPDASGDGGLVWRSRASESTVAVKVSRQDGPSIAHGSFDTDIAVGPRWSPDGRSVAMIVADPQADAKARNATTSLQVLDAHTPDSSFRSLGAVAGNDLAWSPDSSEIASSVATANNGTKIVAIRVQDGKRRDLVLPDPACQVWQPAWAADSVAAVHQCAGKSSLRIYSLR